MHARPVLLDSRGSDWQVIRLRLAIDEISPLASVVERLDRVRWVVAVSVDGVRLDEQDLGDRAGILVLARRIAHCLVQAGSI